MAKQMKVPRGSARALRRKNMTAFRVAQKARRARPTGTIKVNAPSLDLVNKYIGRAGE